MSDEDEMLQEGEEHTFTKGKYKIIMEDCILYVNLDDSNSCKYLTFQRISDEKFYDEFYNNL